MFKILCFGDSITLGEKDTERGGWADRLKKHYFEQFADSQTQKITLYNLGIAGETTDGLVNRFDIELGARNIKGQKLIVVFAYGANDIVIHKDKNIVPESYYIRNLKHCIESAKKFKADILLLNLLPIADSIEGMVNQHGKLRFDHDIQAYNFIIKQLSHEMNCEYLDFYTSFVENNKEEYLCSDGVHPNSKGHKLLYQKIQQKLSALTS
ncbi:MAG: hypothetical protein KZQ70_11335 [gamma proteobacterium symbiont of Lucinoma myriamae]|nr:hypothetical protein [gamma proteobacterium symbiont of Lucinoma myriamae]MCU7818454.1 hypothetical protein [gamma proteobacterium symbiont of Lucinoma myriamae]MCU7833022.1 hypothetical protein [gamma proteobacterium symbiont of Lucinoma myriamae]